MRYIDADELIDFIDCGHLRPPTELAFSDLDVIEMINKQPTADVVEVIRCKDCKYFKSTVCPLCSIQDPALNDYCSYGERAK